MADEVDMAQLQNEKAIEAALQYRKPVSTLSPIGKCHWCEEEFEPDSLKLFCDAACAMRHNRYKGGKK
jgi:hypothetical protein